MVYEEKDVRKAVETARQLVLSLSGSSALPQLMGWSPEGFYEEVVRYAREQAKAKVP